MSAPTGGRQRHGMMTTDGPDSENRCQIGNATFQTDFVRYVVTYARLNYIFWVQDLLDTTSDGYGDQYDRQREVTGLDM